MPSVVTGVEALGGGAVADAVSAPIEKTENRKSVYVMFCITPLSESALI